MVKAIIFDCFGVLAEDGWIPLKRQYVGDNHELAQQLADLGKQNEYGFIDNDSHLTNMAQLMQIDRDVLKQALGKKVPNEELFDFIIQELKPKYRIGLISNANYDVVNDLFTPDQAKIFDASVMSFESRMIKPDKRMFELMAERLGVRMDECVFIDDQERYTVAAEEYGIKSIWYQTLEQAKAEILAALN